MDRDEQGVELLGYFRFIKNMRHSAYLSLKRVVDIFVSGILLIPCMPLFLIVAIWVAIDSRGGVFYTQTRIGQYGKEFKIYKFRTMVSNADEILAKIMAGDSDLAKEYRRNKKMKDDPRVTKAGRFLRRTSIDELPQLINVLLGDMSLVGNRPYLPCEKKEMGKYYNYIIKTKPGMTGCWQVSGRNDISFEKRLKMEADYSENQNLKLDLKIILATPGAVIFGRGAK